MGLEMRPVWSAGSTPSPIHLIVGEEGGGGGEGDKGYRASQIRKKNNGDDEFHLKIAKIKVQSSNSYITFMLHYNSEILALSPGPPSFSTSPHRKAFHVCNCNTEKLGGPGVGGSETTEGEIWLLSNIIELVMLYNFACKFEFLNRMGLNWLTFLSLGWRH